MFLLAHLRLRRMQVWLLLLAGLAAALCFTPLLNLLAYEFCLALALVASLAAAHLGSVAVATARRRDEAMLLALRSPPAALAILLGRIALANVLLLLLPLALITLNALRVKNCDYLEGLALFALMPVLSVVIASAVGAIWALTLPRPVLATAGAILTVLGSLAWGVYRFYDAPPVFGYDPFAGYFPGTIYDEDIRVEPAFLWYRLYNLLWLAVAVLVAARWFEPAALRLERRRARAQRASGLLALALLCVAGATGLYLLRDHAGFSQDTATIRARLGGVRRTAHFDIYYPSELEYEDVELLAQDHELRYAQLAAQVGVAPARVRSFIFRTPEEKRALMGAGRTFIAKPWRDEVYLQRLDFPHPVLKHELAHVFAGQFGDRLFHVSLRWQGTPPRPVFNTGLIEGLAVALDWRAQGELDGHQMAAALVRLGLAPPAESLFGYGFLVEAASRSYVFAGSFCRYLLERHGIAPLRAVYRSGGDFTAAYGRDRSSLLREWSGWLAGVPVPEDQLQLARERFRQPSIVRRVCGHEVASLVARAADLRARNKPDEAARLLERASRFDPGDPAHLLELANALVAARRSAAALEASRRILAHAAASQPLRRAALELAGDLHWRAGALAATRAAYDEASRAGAHAAERRVVALKRWALDQDPTLRDAVRDYLVPPEGKSRDAALEVHLAHMLRRLLPESGIGSFLVGKQLAGHHQCVRAAPELRRALELGLPDEDFVVEARRVLGACLYRIGAYGEAARVFAALRAGSTPRGVQLEAADWLSRLAHRQGRGL